jgi:hypothetical protein
LLIGCCPERSLKSLSGRELRADQAAVEHPGLGEMAGTTFRGTRVLRVRVSAELAELLGWTAPKTSATVVRREALAPLVASCGGALSADFLHRERSRQTLDLLSNACADTGRLRRYRILPSWRACKKTGSASGEAALRR